MTVNTSHFANKAKSFRDCVVKRGTSSGFSRPPNRKAQSEKKCKWQRFGPCLQASSMAASVQTLVPRSGYGFGRKKLPYSATQYPEGPAKTIQFFADQNVTSEWLWSPLLRDRGVSPLSAVSSSPGISSPEMSEDPASLLEKVEVFDLAGKAVPIYDLWRDRKAVVAFARHFGCVLCRKRADFLGSQKDKMDAAGVALVLIGPGTVDQAKAFSEQTEFKGEVYADPDHSSYDALRFVSGVATTFTPLAGLKIIQCYMEGYRQDWALSFQENTVSKGGWQQGGIIVAGPGTNNISYIFKDKEAGDEPEMEDILKACCS